MDTTENSDDFRQKNPSVSHNEDRRESEIFVIAKGGSIAFIGLILTRGFGFISSLVLIRVLGAEGFGQFTLALTVVMFVGLLANIGLPQGVIRFGAINASSDGKAGVHNTTMAALRIVIPISIIVMLITQYTAGTLANKIFHKKELTTIFQILAISIPFMSLQSILLAGTRSLKVIRYSTIVWIVQPLIALFVTLLLVSRGVSVKAAAFAYSISNMCGSLLSLHFYRQFIPPRDRRCTRFKIGQMVKFSIPLSLTEWLHFANERTEIFFLGFLPGSIGISTYKISWSLAGLETMLRLSIEQIFAPFSSELSFRQEIRHLERLYKAVTRWGFTGALIIFLIYVLFGKEILGLFNPELVGGVGVLIALGFAQLFNEFTGPCNTILIMSGRSDLSLMNTIVLFTSSIVLDWLLIPRYGLTGAGIAGAVTIVFVNILRVVEVWWTIRIHPFKLSLVKPVVTGAVTAGIILMLRRFVFPGSWVNNLLLILLFVGAYLMITLLFWIEDEDMELISYVKTKLLSGFMNK